MEGSLKKKTGLALAWSFVEAAGRHLVRFGVSIVLTRLLLPEQFGLIGMLTIFITLSECVLDGGFGAALIQKPLATAKDTSSIFYFNVVIGVVLAGALSIAAPWIAEFYEQPVLVPLIRVLSLTLVFSSFGLIQTIMLERIIDFKRLAKVSILSNVFAGVVAIWMAVAGYGVWSLVGLQLSTTFSRSVLLWFFHSWRPTLSFSFDSLRQMFAFGSRMLLSGVLNRIFESLHLLVIGKLFPVRDLGFYFRGKTFAELPSDTFSEMVTRVTFPVFSTVQADRERLKRAVRKIVTVAVLVNFPMMTGLAVVARPLVLTLFTDKWAESVPYLQLLCVLGFLLPLHVVNLNVLRSLGRSELFLRLEVAKKVLVAMSLLATARWGISAIIYGMIVTSLIGLAVNGYYTRTLLGYALVDQLRDISPYLLMSAVMGAVVMSVGVMPFPGPVMQLAVQVTVGVVIYISLCWLFRREEFVEIWQSGWQLRTA